MSSIIHNPKQVLNYDLLRELTNEVGATSLKPLSRADSFQRHMFGGSVNYFNYKLNEARKRSHLKEVAERRKLEQ